MSNEDLIETMPIFEKRRIWFTIVDGLRTSSKNLTECYFKSELEFYKLYNHRAYRNEETGIRVYYQEFKLKRLRNKARNIAHGGKG